MGVTLGSATDGDVVNLQRQSVRWSRTAAGIDVFFGSKTDRVTKEKGHPTEAREGQNMSK